MKLTPKALDMFERVRAEYGDIYRRTFGREITAEEVFREMEGEEMARRTSEHLAGDGTTADTAKAAAIRTAAHSAFVDRQTPPRYDYEHALSELGEICELSDADDSYEPSEAERIAGLRMFRESSYTKHCKNRAGEIVDVETFQKAYEAREQSRDDTLDMAFKIQAAGGVAFADPKNPVGFIVCPFTGRFHALPNVRARKIFPTVAAAKRARLLLALEFLLRQPGHEDDLFFTLTWAKRCPIWELRNTFAAMQRRLSKLNGQKFMKVAGAQFIFRTSEIGGMTYRVQASTGRRITKTKKNSAKGATVEVRFMDEGKSAPWRRIASRDIEEKEHRDDRGLWQFHPHLHALLHLSRPLNPAEMADLTRLIGQFWGEGWWGIDGKIEKVRECCKYVGKPADIRRMTGPELLQLDDALFGLHLVQPLGELRDQIRTRRESCLKLAREIRTFTDNGEKYREKVIVLQPDWNARKEHRRKPAPPEKLGEFIGPRLPGMEANHAAVMFATPEELAEIGRRQTYAQAELFAVPVEEIHEAPAAASTRPHCLFRNRVVARLSPAPYFDRISTPALWVWDYENTPEALRQLRALPFIAPMIAAVEPQIAEARRRLASGHVHTSPETVRLRPGPLPGLCDPAAWRPETDAVCV